MDELGDRPRPGRTRQRRSIGRHAGSSEIADAADESVEELADTGQDYEAEAIEGVEDAADHPEQPVRTHEGRLTRRPQ